MLGVGSPRRVRLGAGLAVAAVAVAARLVEAHGRLDRVTLAGGADPVAEVNRWLPWQLWDNVANHRAPFDASVFAEGTGSLLDVVGNPGIALLSFGFHAGGSASVGAGLGVLLVLVQKQKNSVQSSTLTTFHTLSFLKKRLGHFLSLSVSATIPVSSKREM